MAMSAATVEALVSGQHTPSPGTGDATSTKAAVIGPSLVLHCCDDRSQAAQEELLTVPAPIGKLLILLSAAGPARGFQPVIGLVTLGEIDAATLTELGKGKHMLLC